MKAKWMILPTFANCKCSKYLTNIGKMWTYFLDSEILLFLFYKWHIKSPLLQKPRPKQIIKILYYNQINQAILKQ